MKYPGLSELLAAILSGHSLELDDLEVAQAGRRSMVRVIVDGDGPAGTGPTLDEIAAATRAISHALDGSDIMGEAPYTLEVSSRGVSRPLTRPVHYRRNVGRLLALTLSDASQLTGRIVSADDVCVVLDVAGQSRSIQLDEVAMAVVQIEMNRRPAAVGEAPNWGDDQDDDDTDGDEDDDTDDESE